MHKEAKQAILEFQKEQVEEQVAERAQQCQADAAQHALQASAASQLYKDMLEVRAQKRPKWLETQYVIVPLQCRRIDIENLAEGSSRMPGVCIMKEGENSWVSSTVVVLHILYMQHVLIRIPRAI